MPTCVVTLVIAVLLTGCAVDGYDAGGGNAGQVSNAPPESWTFPDGRSYGRVHDCTPLVGNEARADPAYNSPPEGMAIATWQRIIEEIYASEHSVDQACRDGRLYVTTLSGKVTRLGVLLP